MSKVFVAIGKRQQRFELYRKLDADLIIFPELEIANNFSSETIWSSALSGTEKTKLWLELLGGHRKKVISTRTGVFLPFGKISRIVIDEPNHPGHREEKSPKYQTFDVALKLAQIHNADLIIGIPVMTVDAYYNLKNRRFRLLPMSRWQMPEIEITNNYDYKPTGNVLYFLPQKGDYRGAVCSDCKKLQPYPTPMKCSQCGGTNFRPYGIGTQALAEKLSAIVIDQNSPLKIGNSLPAQSGKLKTVVATHKIFDYDLEFDTTVVSHIDHLLNLPDPFISEEIRTTLLKLAQITKHKLVIQTKNPDHSAIKFINSPRRFFEDELVKRKQYNLPPFLV